MNVRLAYGKTGLQVSLPDDANVTVLEPTYVPGHPSPVGALVRSLEHPIASPPLKELVHPSDTVGIAFSDITRPTPNHLILPVLLDELAHVPTENVTLFNGTGTHRSNTVDELRQMLSSPSAGPNDAIVDHHRIVQNDARDRASHALAGTTSAGNDIWLHRDFLACDVKILTGFIEPHLFAGFSGGGKAVMPGLALLETVMRNHSAQNLDSSGARWGIREGNPLWEDIREAAAMADPTFLLNVTLNRDQEITGVFSGDWEEAHARGCAFVRETAMVPVDEPFDLVITSNSGYPLDLNLYQAVKGMSAAAQIVKEGGSIIVAADCWDGIPEHGDYGQLLYEADSVASLLKAVREADIKRQDTWQAHVQALISQKAHVYVYSSNLTDEQVRAALLNPCHSIQDTVEQLRDRYGPDATICVLPEGPQTVPYVRNS